MRLASLLCGLALGTLSAAASAQATSSAPYNGLSTWYWGSVNLMTPPDYSATAWRNYDDGVSFGWINASHILWTLDMSGPGNQPLTVGLYPNATRFPFQAAGTPGFDFGGNGFGCNQSLDTFYVREAAYGADGSVQSFAADFEQACDASPIEYGEVRYNSSLPLSAVMAKPWRTDVSLPAKVDLNGDGKEDILLEGLDGSWVVDLMDGLTVLESVTVIPAHTGRVVLRTGDFDGDGKTDLVVQNFDTSVEVWLMDGTLVKAVGALMPAGRGWVVSHVGDFNGDGKSDLVWTHIYDGSVGIWLMDGTTQLARKTMLVPYSNYAPMGVGDFDGDGKSDILWRNSIDGTTSIWLMDGLTIREKGPIMGATSFWNVAGLGDFDGDGKSDIVWHNQLDGSNSMWLMDGRTVKERGTLGAGGLQLLFVAKLDDDNKSDILWRRVSDGAYIVRFMDGRNLKSSGILTTAMSLPPVLLRDLDGDGKADLVLRDPDFYGFGTRVQLLSGSTAGTEAGISTYPPHLGSEFRH